MASEDNHHSRQQLRKVAFIVVPAVASLVAGWSAAATRPPSLPGIDAGLAGQEDGRG
jgi:hypothetical protein